MIYQRQEGRCLICEKSMVWGSGNGGKGAARNNLTLDRINPKLGYIDSNIQLLCKKCNQMKNDANPEELVYFARKILQLYAEAHWQ